VLGVTRGVSSERLRRAFIELARSTHPDTHPGDKAAEERFKIAAAAYDVLSDPGRRAEYDKSRAARSSRRLVTRSSTYAVAGLYKSGDLADLYDARRDADGKAVLLKVAREPSVNDLLTAESIRLRQLVPAGTEPGSVVARYYPELIESFSVGGRVVNVFTKLDEYASLRDVVASSDGGVAFEHGVWMFNRILEGLDRAHAAGLVYGAGVPSNVLVWLDPRGHLVKLADWGYGGLAGEKLKAAVPGQERFYPEGVLAGGPASPATDVYMAAKLVLYALRKDAPEYVTSFLRGCVSGRIRQDAWHVHEELRDHMERHFGPKRFVPFENSMWDSLKR